MGSVYAVANQKGGVGKTTTAVNIAACAAQGGDQVLICDLDSQCNATVALGLGRELRPSSYECLMGERSVAEAARPAGPDNLWIVPANRDLAGASIELPRIEGSERTLRETLGPVRERFALTLLDCPPALGPVTVNAQVLSVLHSFNGTDGQFAESALVQGSDGNFYGTTVLGGANHLGTVFKSIRQGT